MSLPNERQRPNLLKSIGIPALAALRKVAGDDDAEVARQAARLIQIVENGLEQLLIDYRGYDSPLPPDDARLVRFESGGRYILNGELRPPTYAIGFLLSPLLRKARPFCWWAPRN